MQRLLVAIVAMVAGTCCSHRGPINIASPEAPDTSHVMAMVGRFSVAHGCPISESRILTSAHVIDMEPGNRDFLYQSYRWSDDAGNEGFAVPEAVIAASDLAVMTSVPKVAFWYERTTNVPEPGQKLWLVEFDFDGTEQAFRAKPVRVEVIRVVAGNVIFTPSGAKGSSGSCVLDAEGKLVAIQAWGWHVGWAGGEQVGVAVGVWGRWFEIEESK